MLKLFRMLRPYRWLIAGIFILLTAQSLGEVRFEGVSFRYKPDTPLIEDMNLQDTMPPMQTISSGPCPRGTIPCWRTTPPTSPTARNSC